MPSMSISNQIAANKQKTWLIMFFFTLFVFVVVFIFSSALGLGSDIFNFIFPFLIFTILMNVSSYFWSDKIVMAISKAKQLGENDNPELFQLVRKLTTGENLPMPKVYLINEMAPNAFATGRDPKHASIAVTRGILNKLNEDELEGVLAHELSHVQNFDIRLMTVVSILVGSVALLSDFFVRSILWGNSEDRNRGGGLILILTLLAAIIAPITAQLIQLAISRRREFLADASGAALTHNPEGLASALIKISSDRTPLKAASTATAHLYFENPFKTGIGSNSFTKFFMTHPPIEERVEALRKMK